MMPVLVSPVPARHRGPKLCEQPPVRLGAGLGDVVELVPGEGAFATAIVGATVGMIDAGVMDRIVGVHVLPGRAVAASVLSACCSHNILSMSFLSLALSPILCDST